MKLSDMLNIKSENATVLDLQNEASKSLNRLMAYRGRLCRTFGEETVADFERKAGEAVSFEIEGTELKPDSDMDGEWFEMAEIQEVFSFALDDIGESENGAFGRRILNKKSGYGKRLYDLEYRSNDLYKALRKRKLL